MEGNINLYDQMVPALLFSKMVANNNCYRAEGLVCMDCGRHAGYYLNDQALADHVTAYHPNDQKWDINEVVAETLYKVLTDKTPAKEPAKEPVPTVVAEPVDLIAQKIESMQNAFEQVEELQTKICLKMDNMPDWVIGPASQQQIAFLLTGREFTYSGSQKFAAKVGFAVNNVNDLAVLHRVWNRILISEKAYEDSRKK